MKYSKRIYEKFITEIKNKNLIKQGDSILIALSGGPDSICLFHLLVIFARKNALKLAAAYVDHGLRPKEVKKEIQLTKKITRQFDVNLFIAHIKVKKMKSGPEASARNLRYIALMSIAADNEYNKIATAHTSSDVAETVLLNLIRSPGIEGIFGIPSIREMKDTKTGIKISIIRPLLTISRDEVMCYLTENKLEYATDTSNYDTRFTRNYIRHKIIPLFEKINPGISSNLSNLSQWAVEARKCLSEKTKKIISGIARKTREGIRIDLSKFLKYNYNSKLRILDLILRDFFSVPSINQINAVNKIASEIKGKKLLKLNNSVVLEKSNDFLILKKKNGKNKTVQRD